MEEEFKFIVYCFWYFFKGIIGYFFFFLVEGSVKLSSFFFIMWEYFNIFRFFDLSEFYWGVNFFYFYKIVFYVLVVCILLEYLRTDVFYFVGRIYMLLLIWWMIVILCMIKVWLKYEVFAIWIVVLS